MIKRSTIISFAGLVLLLTAGAAQGLSGSNTVFSDDIVDGTITHGDVKPNSLGGSRLLNNAITGSKVFNNSITGTDVNEATLEFPCGSPAGPSFATIDLEGIDGDYDVGPVESAQNCAGETVLVKTLGTGVTCVKFVDSTQTHAVVSIVGTTGLSGLNTFAGSAACNGTVTPTPGEFQVLTRDGTNVLANIPFTILAF